MPLVARGRGTNTTGASVPINGGVVASFERMNRILRIDPDNRLAVVEPGVLNGDLQTALAPHGLFWAPDPTSAPFCTIAGNIACNAGGPRAVKYGATRDNVLALRAVAGSGEDFRCGKPTTKGATGYDLTRLLIGSEGTLAIVTEATLKLTPLADGETHVARDLCRCRRGRRKRSRGSWRSRSRRARWNSSTTNACCWRARTVAMWFRSPARC